MTAEHLPAAQGLPRLPLGHDRWAAYRLTVVRATWIAVTLLTLGLSLAGIPRGFESLAATADRRSLAGLGISAGEYAGFVLALDMLVVLAHFGIALVIFWRRSNHWMCLLVAFTLSTNGAVIPLSLMYAASGAHPAGLFLSRVVIYLGLVSSVALLYLFPDGRFVPPWTRWLAALWAALALPAIFVPGAPIALPRWPLVLQVLVLLAWTGTGAFAQVYRYLHVASPVERQQAKWGLLGILAASLAPFAFFLPFVIVPALSGPRAPNLLYQRIGANLFAFSLVVRLLGLGAFAVVRLLFPLSFAIAILRYRLWDIDILINRALVYSALTGALALAYFTSVLLLQTVFRALTGEGQSMLVTVVSTLAIAALFSPLRRRIQDVIDRRFYRRKYDAAKTLAAFSATMRDEVDLSALTGRLVSLVEDTMQPEHVTLWLREPPKVP